MAISFSPPRYGVQVSYKNPEDSNVTKTISYINLNLDGEATLSGATAAQLQQFAWQVATLVNSTFTKTTVVSYRDLEET